MRTHYSEFVRHILRNYVNSLEEGRGGQPIFKTNAERENWSACHYVLNDYPQDVIDILIEIYRPGDTIPDKIYQLALARRESQGKYWSLISKVEQKVAQKRGLI